MEANDTYIEWLCEKCRSPRVYLFGANLKWLRISEDEEAWIEAEEDMRELTKIMSNNKRQVAIYKIEEMN